MKTLALVLALAFLPACTATKAFIVSGEVIDDAGQKYIATGKAMRSGLNQGTVTPAQFREWAAFAERFDLSYDVAADSWKAAQKVGDAVEKKKAADAIEAIVRELLKFYGQMKEAHLLPAGAT